MKQNRKQELWKNLQDLKTQAEKLEGEEERMEMKKILIQVGEIVNEFNKGKNPDGPIDLNLNDIELKQLRDEIDEIWARAEKKNLVSWPKPDIVAKVG